MRKISYLLLICLSYAFSCKDTKTFVSDRNAEIAKKNTVSDTANIVQTMALQSNPINKKWYGRYHARFDYEKIGGMNVGWDLEIIINSKSIIASGSGYQIGFKDELTANEEGNKLILKHKKNLDGYTLGENMNPEFVLINDHGKFYIQSDWIDSDIVTQSEKNGFVISKEK